MSDTATQLVEERHIAAPQQRVWDALLQLIQTSASGDYHRYGEPAPHGPGSVKVFDVGEFAACREITTDLEPPRLRGYEIVAGAPTESYRGSIALSSTDDGTLITWTVNMVPLATPAGEKFAAMVPTFLSGVMATVASIVE